MTLARQLRLSGTAAILAALGLAALAGLTALRWHRAVEDLRASGERRIFAERLRADLFRQVKEVNEWLFYGSGAVDDPAGVVPPTAALVEQFARLEASDVGHPQVAALRALHQQVADARESVLDLLGRGEAGAARDLLEAALERRLFDRLDDVLRELDAFYAAQSEAAVAEIEAATRQGAVLVGAIAGLAVLQAGLLWFAAHRRVVRPLGRLALGVERIGQGALDHRVPVDRADELGELAARVNAMAAALDESRGRLVRAERLATIGELAPYLAHNLRNPLASIRSAAQVTGRDLDAGDRDGVEAARATMRDVVDTIDRLDAWIGRILVAARPGKLDPRPHHVLPMLEELVAALRLAAGRRGVTLALDTAPRLPRVRIDRDATLQALAAIVTNAIEASPEGGTVRLAAVLEPPGVSVTVADEGPGVPEALKERLFAPAVSTRRDGRGIGLWLARSILESQSASIALGAARPTGTLVRVLLPTA